MHLSTKAFNLANKRYVMHYSIFDVIGPVMIGPSSSHTAGAARIGFEMSKTISGKINSAEIILYNSFADTGEGHGTKIALLGGLLGISPENLELKESFSVASENKMAFVFRQLQDNSKHPNSVMFLVQTDYGCFSGFGESLGGGLIKFRAILPEVRSVGVHAKSAAF